MYIIIGILLIEISNLLAFFIGAKISQKIQNNEKLEIPSPIKLYQEHKEYKEMQIEKEKTQTMLENIDNYDGTGYGQKDL